MGPAKYVFVKKYDHHLSFQVYDANDKPLWRRSFQTVAEAQAEIPAGMKVEWGELIDQVDYNQTKTENAKRQIEKAFFNYDVEEADI